MITEDKTTTKTTLVNKNNKNIYYDKNKNVKYV